MSRREHQWYRQNVVESHEKIKLNCGKSIAGKLWLVISWGNACQYKMFAWIAYKFQTVRYLFSLPTNIANTGCMYPSWHGYPINSTSEKWFKDNLENILNPPTLG